MLRICYLDDFGRGGKLAALRSEKVRQCQGKPQSKERPEHEANSEPRNLAKHERGQRRKLMGKGKEKKQQKPDWFQR